MTETKTKPTLTNSASDLVELLKRQHEQRLEVIEQKHRRKTKQLTADILNQKSQSLSTFARNMDRLRFWSKVWQVLVEECGADKREDNGFVARLGDFEEWRFDGRLGSGGKLYQGIDGLWVGCYKEDDTPERLEIIDRANKRLSALGDPKQWVKQQGSSPSDIAGSLVATMLKKRLAEGGKVEIPSLGITIGDDDKDDDG